MECVYKIKNNGCGKVDACKGCRHDPNKSTITRDEFLDMCSHFGCGLCKHFQVDADRREDTTCKRIDHKHFQFAKPWFKSYDCGQNSSIICKDFEPDESYMWLYNHWQGWDFLFGDKIYKDNETIGLCIDKDQSIRYKVKREDFVNGTFIDEDGNLKWVEKMYYKRTEDSPIGYHLVHEYRNND